EGWRRQRRPRSGPQRRAELPQGEAVEQDAPEHDRPGRAALQEGRRAAGQALLHRACLDGEPPRPGGRRRRESGDRHGRAGERARGWVEGGAGGIRRLTLGGDRAYAVTKFVHALRARSTPPHIAIDGHLSKTGKRRKTAVDGRTTRHAGYDISQRCRKRIEE